MNPHPSLSDWSDERRFSELVAQHRSGFAAGTEQPAPAEACTELGADAVIRESERDPWLWRLMPAAIAIGALSAAWLQFGGPL